MKTMRRREIAGTARFLTFSCYRRLRLFDSDRIKDCFVRHLARALTQHGVELIAWVVMPHHVHLVVFPIDGSSLVSFLASLKRLHAKEVLDRWRELGAGVLPRLRDRQGDLHFWQMGGGYDRNVVGEELIEKIRYVHANPVARSLSPDSTSWRWSSARAFVSRDDAMGPVPAFDLIPDHEGDLT